SIETMLMAAPATRSASGEKHMPQWYPAHRVESRRSGTARTRTEPKESHMTHDGPRTVLVTGASGGIGRASAIALGARGDRVALLARGRAGLAGAGREVEEAGGTALTVPTDVSDPDEVETAARTVEEELGEIDVWVNCAFSSVFAPVWEI